MMKKVRIVKICRIEAVIRGQCLFNMFLNFGILLASCWKLCSIPNDENGDLNHQNNYRHIAISSCILKLFEVVLLVYIQCIVEFSDCQFGFRNIHSINTAYALLKKVASEFRCKDSYMFMCFLDIDKAFNYISPYRIMRQKIEIMRFEQDILCVKNAELCTKYCANSDKK